MEKHLEETRKHAGRIQQRLDELDAGRNALQVLVGFTESLVSQALTVSKVPFDLLRGTGGEEKVLKNAKDACASEALEIATYTAWSASPQAQGRGYGPAREVHPRR